ncbi:ABC transporter permease [Oceanivirga salmonicida]|uniref:ABC transporter permease n=1 Tax=Oceanivirga salmonicida TaxID=1769291 RepID=UPI00082EB7C1|nr:ABC transporter permease subunit [Oceanivirga salmonicida]
MKLNKELKISIVLITIIFLIAIFTPIITPHDAFQMNIKNKLIYPCKEYILGTDNRGRDILSRLILGTRVTLVSSLFVVFINLMISIPLGIISGYIGGFFDTIISRFIEIIMAFPQIIISLYLLANWGPGFGNLLFSLILVGWVKYARIIRGNTKKIKHLDFIKSAKISGSSELDIILKHILPNIISPVLSIAALDISHVILSISALSFIGLGIAPPTPEWGIMLNEAKPFIGSHSYMMWGPGLCILGVVLSFDLLSRGLKLLISED